MTEHDPQLVARFRDAMARRYAENASAAMSQSVGMDLPEPVPAPEGSSKPQQMSSDAGRNQQRPSVAEKQVSAEQDRDGYRVLVCGAPDDPVMIVVDWLLLAAAHNGKLASATPLPVRRGRPSGTVIEIGVETARRASYDLIIASDHSHLARALSSGASDRARTTIVASSSRLYSDGERDAPRHEVVSEREIDQIAGESCARYTCFDAGETAAWFSLPRASRPALLVGAAVVESLPGLSVGDLRTAIRRLGIDVSTSLRALKVGTRYGKRSGGRPAREVDAQRYVRRARDKVVRAQRKSVDELVDLAHKLTPLYAPDVRACAVRVLEHGDAEAAERLVRLCAELNELERSRGIHDTAGSAVPIFAAGLARIMCYQDPVWDATVRLRARRLGEIRARHGIARADHIVVQDLLAWTASELAATQKGRALDEASWISEPVTTVAIDAGTIRGLVRLSQIRRRSQGRKAMARHASELEAADEYAKAVFAAMQVDASLASRVARTAALVQGSGSLRVGSRQLAVALWGRVVAQSVSIDRLAGDTTFGFSKAVIPFALDQVAREGLVSVWELAGQVVGIGMHASRGGSREEVLVFADHLCRPRPAARVAFGSGAEENRDLQSPQSSIVDVIADEADGSGVEESGTSSARSVPFARRAMQLSAPRVPEQSLAEALADDATAVVELAGVLGDEDRAGDLPVGLDDES